MILLQHMNPNDVNDKGVSRQSFLNASAQISCEFKSWFINKEFAYHFKAGHTSYIHMNSTFSSAPKMSNSQKLNIVNRFLKQNPAALSELREILLTEKKNFNAQKPMPMKMYNYVIEHGNKTIASSETYNAKNVNYSVKNAVYSMKINGTLYKENASIVHAPNGIKLIDPTVMVQINYLTQSFGWFGTLTYGEVDFIYENYMNNAQPEVGYNYNEAEQLVHIFLEFSTGGAVTSSVLIAVLSLAASAIGDLGTIAGIGTAVYEAADLGYAYGELSLAYSSDSNSLPIVIQNDYIWDLYLGIMVNGRGMKVYVDNDGWQQALYPLVFSGIDSPALSSFAHSFQSKYSSNWHWVGLYTGS